MQIVQEFDMPPLVEGVDAPAPQPADAVIFTRDDVSRVLGELRAGVPPRPTGQFRGKGGGRRDARRWIPPDTIEFEIYDGEGWHRLHALDCGVPGARVTNLPVFVKEGFVALRLTIPEDGVVLVAGEIMWLDAKAGIAGIQFTFENNEDREAWFEGLVEALLSRHAMN